MIVPVVVVSRDVVGFCPSLGFVLLLLKYWFCLFANRCSCSNESSPSSFCLLDVLLFDCFRFSRTGSDSSSDSVVACIGELLF